MLTLWRVLPSQERTLPATSLAVPSPRLPRLDTAQIEPMILSRLRTRSASPAASARPPQARPTAAQGSFLRGSLSTLPPQELLEYLALLRRPGSLTVRSLNDRVAQCEISEDHLLSAELGRLRGAEAIFELLSWKDGNFELRPVGPPREGQSGEASRSRLAELSMQYARLADELERRAELLPAEDEPLVLRLGKPLPADHLETGLAELAAQLEAAPGRSRSELEADSALCCTKVRLALAQLVAAGCL